MGLLNFLQSGWGQTGQQGLMPGEWDWMQNMGGWGQMPGQQFPQMQFPGMPQQQQRPTQFPQARAPAAMPQPDENGISGPMPSMVSQVGTATPPPVKPPGFGERFQGFMDPNNQRGLFGPGMQMAMSLLGNGANGGRWDRVGADMRSIQENQGQQASQRFQQSMMMQNWRRQEEQRARLNKWAESQDEFAQIDPASAYAASAEARARANMPLTQAEKMDFDLRREDLAARRGEFQQTQALGWARLNQDRMLNSTLAGLGKDEAGYVAGMRQKLDTGRAVMSKIDELEGIVKTRPEIFGALLEPDMETAIRKFGLQDPAAITDIQRVWSIGADFAREELRGMTPVSNLDLKVALQTGATTQQTAAALNRWIASARGQYRSMEGQYQSALKYMQPAPGVTRNLFEVDPSTGKNWYQTTYSDWGGPSDGRDGWRGARGQGGRRDAPAPVTTPEKPRYQRGDIRQGDDGFFQFQGGDDRDRRNWKKVKTNAYGQPITSGPFR